MSRTTHAAALALSLLMTIGIFSSVSQLYAPDHTGAVLAAAEPVLQAQHTQPAQRS